MRSPRRRHLLLGSALVLALPACAARQRPAPVPPAPEVFPVCPGIPVQAPCGTATGRCNQPNTFTCAEKGHQGVCSHHLGVMCFWP